MQPIEKYLQLFFDKLDALQKNLSERWREHANRRTIVVLILLGIASAAGYLYVIRPPDNFPIDQLVTVPQGASLKEIADTLYEDDVIRSPLAFRIIETITGHEYGLRAGDYLFKQPFDVFTISRDVAIGAYGLTPIKIRIPEGATTQQMALIYSTDLQRFNAQNFLAEAQPMEGYLFPDTYFFLPNATAQTVIEAMTQDFDAQIQSIQPQIASSTHSLAQIVTMASIIEREAPDMQDRRMIAGVLWRRLQIGMPLQADPTLLYVLPLGSSITPSDLKIQSPYNTYLHSGLPPTPIGSPSLDSLIAAATPIDDGYLFYLADDNGVTHYSKTYAGQLANERRYYGN